MSLSIDLLPDARPATVTLRLAGTATYHEAPELRQAVFEAIDRARGKNLVVELEEVVRMDTAALAVLVEALMVTKDGDPAVFLMHPNPSVRRVFRLAGLEDALTRCFDCWEDIAAAIAV
jgi:anti-anti-sigma factor